MVVMSAGYVDLLQSKISMYICLKRSAAFTNKLLLTDKSITEVSESH